jgi:hypothetical protein
MPSTLTVNDHSRNAWPHLRAHLVGTLESSAITESRSVGPKLGGNRYAGAGEPT